MSSSFDLLISADNFSGPRRAIVVMFVCASVCVSHVSLWTIDFELNDLT